MTLSNADWERLNHQLLFPDSERVERTFNYFNNIDSEIHISETNGVVSITSPRLEFDKIKSAIKKSRRPTMTKKKTKSKVNIPKGYIKKSYTVNGKTEYRINPDYPDWKDFTVTVCHKCEELFEVSETHICKQQNSYPKEVILGEKEDA